MPTPQGVQRLLLGITGATGMLYLPPFLRLLATQEQLEVHAIISHAGRQVLAFELGLIPEELPGIHQWFAIDDFAAPPSSGSSVYDAMVILPCTMGTLAAVAGGTCLNLIHRCADVALKERRILILALRESPLNRNHLRNMLLAHEAGAVLCPLMPSFYQQPKNLEEMATGMATRICDLLGLQLADSEQTRWQGM